jgi:salicylate hydroxylase
VHVLIAGAGVGGLCLAQGLRAGGVRVSVFERDPDLGERDQGYRIHIDGHGGEALRRCLPEDLYRLYLATSSVPGAGRISTLGTDLSVLSTFDVGTGGEHSAVNRRTLRQILFAGLGRDVHFGHRVTGADQDADGVRVRFEGGREVRGDVLVGADGVHSAVRAAVAPGSPPIDTGLRCVYGRTPLAALPDLPARFFDGFTAVAGGTATLALAAFRARTPVFPPDLTPVADYLMWAVVGAAPDEQEPAGHRPELAPGAGADRAPRRRARDVPHADPDVAAGPGVAARADHRARGRDPRDAAVGRGRREHGVAGRGVAGRGPGER